MTVEEYLRAPFNELTIKVNTIKAAALSPAKLRRADFRAVNIDDEYDTRLDDDVFVRSVEYALSTLYYSMSSTVTGGSHSEKRGNRSVSIGGYALTTRDREAFRKAGDNIRIMLGLEPQSSVIDSGGAFDARYLRNVRRTNRTTQS